MSKEYYTKAEVKLLLAELKKEILEYNEDDVEATLRLEEWLKSIELNIN